MSRLWLLLSILLTACGSHLPWMSVPDTRELDTIVFESRTWDNIVLTVIRAEPNEILLCLYGKFKRETKAVVLYINKYILAEIDSVTPKSVYYKRDGPCKSRKNYVGTLHSHPTAVHYPNSKLGLKHEDVCAPSISDYRSVKQDDYSAVLVIFCGQGLLYFEFRNGDYGYGVWRP